MTNRNIRQDPKLNERIAAIRENNARLENRHKVSLIVPITSHPQEIELDKKRAAETGSSILPSQIRVTISRQDIQSNRNGTYDSGNFRGKQRQNYRLRGGSGGGGTGIGYNLSKSLSRLHQDSNYNSQPQFVNNCPKGRGSYARGGGNNSSEYVRHVEIDRSGGRGKSQKHHQYPIYRNCYGSRNGQQHYYQQQQPTLTPAKSMPSLDPSNLRQNSRPYHQRGGGSGGGFRPQQLPPPRFRHNSFRASGGAIKLRQTPERQMVPPPPPPFPPPSPSQPTPAFWPPPPVPKGTDGQWVRGNVIRSKDMNIRRVVAIGTQSDDTAKAPADSDSPFVNAEDDNNDDDDDDDDGYIDDNPLDDLDQFTLKIDMDGGFIVYDATICDPILSKPISSWIDDVTSEVNDSDAEGRDGRQGSTSSPPSQKVTTNKAKGSPERAGKDALDMDSYIFSNSSLTTSGLERMFMWRQFRGHSVQITSTSFQSHINTAMTSKTAHCDFHLNRTAAFYQPLLHLQEIKEVSFGLLLHKVF
ncbi:hypothetical protein TcWFU_009513 [Taenia crassiceps]|uniref:Uncharacterized protein n=1 Tax=Taenia crassiceps TaxID=6207 RepID=A0ABR4Q2K1_9CEST